MSQLLAYESILQFAPKSAWPALKSVADGQGTMTTVKSLLPMIPALAIVALHELSVYSNVTELICEIAALVLDRATTVLASLSHHDPNDALIDPVEEDWREVSNSRICSILALIALRREHIMADLASVTVLYTRIFPQMRMSTVPRLRMLKARSGARNFTSCTGREV